MTFFGTTSTHGEPVGLRRIWQLLRAPVSPDTRAGLEAAWQSLDPRFRTANQMFGRHEEGCGATIGVMPKCDRHDPAALTSQQTQQKNRPDTTNLLVTSHVGHEVSFQDVTGQHPGTG